MKFKELSKEPVSMIAPCEIKDGMIKNRGTKIISVTILNLKRRSLTSKDKESESKEIKDTLLIQLTHLMQTLELARSDFV